MEIALMGNALLEYALIMVLHMKGLSRGVCSKMDWARVRLPNGESKAETMSLEATKEWHNNDCLVAEARAFSTCLSDCRLHKTRITAAAAPEDVLMDSSLLTDHQRNCGNNRWRILCNKNYKSVLKRDLIGDWYTCVMNHSNGFKTYPEGSGKGSSSCSAVDFALMQTLELTLSNPMKAP
ncbi:hypothetical protein SAY87_023871 [Trapa incisa]|uniref:Uncharacterized protein n=1 Tax=Trapa incisa TaxID=236973 RepID=A0AAN7QU71_9MYRT|nr:hypothetical protein SAY87_023871 [Trapa incisa]